MNTSSQVKKLLINKRLLILLLSFSVKFLAKTLFRLTFKLMSQKRKNNQRDKVFILKKILSQKMRLKLLIRFKIVKMFHLGQTCVKDSKKLVKYRRRRKRKRNLSKKLTLACGKRNWGSSKKPKNKIHLLYISNYTQHQNLLACFNIKMFKTLTTTQRLKDKLSNWTRQLTPVLLREQF